MKKKIIIGLLMVALIYVGGLVGFYYGYNKGVEQSRAETAALAELQDSRVIHDLKIDTVLKGKVVEVSVSDRTVVLQANGDSLTVYLREDAIMPIPGQEPQKIEMESIKIGEEVTIVAVLTEKLEGTTFFIGDVKVKLR